VQDTFAQNRTQLDSVQVSLPEAFKHSYLVDHLIPASDSAPGRGCLRSANLNRLIVPRCRLSTYGCRAFDYAGPTVWNSLPDELRNSDSFDSFRRFMKTILFSRY